jgi:hypothetical protein
MLEIEHHFLGENGEEVKRGRPFAFIRSVVRAINVSVSTFKEGLQGELASHNLHLGNVTRISFADNPGYPVHLQPFKGLEKCLAREPEEGKNGKYQDIFILEWKKPSAIPAQFIMKCTVEFMDMHLDVEPLMLHVGDQDKQKGGCAVQ